MTKLWFMDVDGVLAPFRKGGAFLDWVRSPHERYELWLSPTQAGLIADVLQSTDTQLIWVSTWADDAGRYVDDFFGWPRHRFAPMPTPDMRGSSIGPRGRWWKLDAVDDLVAELQPDRFVWSDDDHPRHRTSVGRWLETVDAEGLIQAPKSHVGLSQRWIREAESISGDPDAAPTHTHTHRADHRGSPLVLVATARSRAARTDADEMGTEPQ